MAEREWTVDQQNAIKARNGTLLLSAAAGSGKTSVLVERIVRRLLDAHSPCPPDALLVVTFTNAAAAEMRTRIVDRLKALSSDPAARAAVQRIVPRLDEMSVCTMDSFCMDLVRRNHAPLGLEPDFGVMEEGEERALKYAVAAEVIEDAYAASDADFLALARQFTRGRDDAELTNGILYLSDYSMSEPSPEAWLRGVADHFLPLPAGESVWGRLLLRHFANAADYCRRLAEAAIEDVMGEENLEPKFTPLLTLISDRAADLASVAAGTDWNAAGKALDALYAAAKATLPTPKGYKDHPLKVAAGAKKDEVKSVAGKLMNLYPATEEEHAGDIAALAPAARGLIGAVLAFNERLLAEKKEKNEYSFADIEHFAMDLLCDPASSDGKTALARELSEDFAEVLIDEYQDTNRAQDAIFRALSKNGDNLFTVGDVKQSIYRFRLASPELFLERAAEYPLYTPDERDRRAKILLGSNFRSRAGVTGAVNFVFRRLMSKNVGDMEYTEDQWLRPAAEYPGKDEPDVEFHMVETGGEYSPAEAEARYIAALIENKVSSGLTLGRPGKERPASYGDFCILLRSARGSAETYANALRARGIPVQLDAKDGFFDSAEVRMAKSLLRAVDNPMRDIDLLAFLISPVGGFTAEEVADLRASHTATLPPKKKAPLWAALTFAAENGHPKAAAASGFLTHYKRVSAAVTAAEVVGRIFDETSLLPAAAAMTEGYLRVANLRVLYETALKFCADGEKTLSSFVRYLERMEENDARMPRATAGAGAKSVRIMTTHGSKGLEFPVVILAGLTKRFNLQEKSSTLFVSHELGVGFKRREPEKLKFYETLSSAALKRAHVKETVSEELRIWYVAMTRAAESLVFVAAPKNWQNEMWTAETLIGEQDVLPPFYAETSSGPLKWILGAFCRHPDFAPFRQTDISSVPADFRIRTVLSPVPEAPETVSSAAPAPDPALVRALETRMQKTYAYLPLCEAPALHAASHLREEKFSEEYFGKKVPAFLLAGGMTPADVGTATHKFLQFTPFDRIPASYEAEADRLVESGRLSRAEADAVNGKTVDAFFRSAFFERILRSPRLHKEFSFNLMKSVRDFDPSLPEAFENEKAVVIGKIDLVFEEDGKGVIVDYKTDHVKHISELKDRYSGQLDLYAEAVERVLGLEVKEKVLYSLTRRDFVSWT